MFISKKLLLQIFAQCKVAHLIGDLELTLLHVVFSGIEKQNH